MRPGRAQTVRAWIRALLWLVVLAPPGALLAQSDAKPEPLNAPGPEAVGAGRMEQGAPGSCSNRRTAQQIDARIDALIAQMSAAERIGQLQDRAPALPRLGLPAYNWWSEGLHGAARDGYATVFPQAIGLAATWDAALLRAVGDTAAREARAKFNAYGGRDTPRFGGLTIWSPNINIFRDPRWGRGQETYGEDPFLTATLGSAFVNGMQGDDAFYLQADATPKHFVAHSGPERGRDSFNAVVSPHDLADTYLPAFHALTAEAHAAAMMCSYNEIDGIPSCASAANLQKMAREHWGFGGYVVSDCDAVGDIAEYHHFAADAAHAAADALNAGVDLDCGNTYAALQQSLAQGLTTEAQVNRALHRLLWARVRLGMLDPAACSPYEGIGDAEINSPAHRALALRAAEESVVLLKNDGVLPLVPDRRRIAVIGPTADMLKVLEANYHGTAEHPVTLLDGMLSTYKGARYAQGSVLAQGVPIPIPRTALRTGGAADGEQGLVADYFPRAAFEGTPTLRKTVPTVDLDLDRAGPAPEIPAGKYAARWTGLFLPPAPGAYVLRVHVERCWGCKTHDSFRLWVDGELRLDNHGEQQESDEITLHLSDTTPHRLRLELMHTGQDEGIALEWTPPASALLGEAMRLARTADVVVVFAGLSPDLEGEALQLQLDGFDGGDRTRLDLPDAQKALLSRLQELRKPTIVVLTSGSAVALGPEASDAAAVLEAWYPGEAGGTALGEVLRGTVNPSGRLPVTFYRSVQDLPAFTDYSMAHRTYRYYAGPVLYPFGYGLSYSRFAFGPVRLEKSTLLPGEPLTATVTVRNDGKLPGTAVAELYLRPPQLPGAPRLSLQGVQRVKLRAGEERELSFTLTPEQISTVDARGVRRVQPGTYQVLIGGSQPNLTRDQGASFKVGAAATRR